MAIKLTHALLGEHAVIYRLLSHIEQSAAGWDHATLLTIGATLKSALAEHAHVEDQMLFDRLAPLIGEDGPLAVMREEHSVIEGCLERLPSSETTDVARGLLREVVSTARAHFAKEEQVLFPLAEQQLGETLEALGDEWSGRCGVTVAC